MHKINYCIPNILKLPFSGKENTYIFISLFLKFLYLNIPFFILTEVESHRELTCPCHSSRMQWLKAESKSDWHCSPNTYLSYRYLWSSQLINQQRYVVLTTMTENKQYDFYLLVPVIRHCYSVYIDNQFPWRQKFLSPCVKQLKLQDCFQNCLPPLILHNSNNLKIKSKMIQGARAIAHCQKRYLHWT